MNALEDGIYDALYGSTAVYALVGARIYRQQAPPGASYPLLVYNYQGGGDDNLTPNRSVNFLYTVRAVSETSQSEAGAIAETVDGVLHGGSLVVSGWTSIQMHATTRVRFTETANGGKVFHHAGAIYRIRLD